MILEFYVFGKFLSAFFKVHIRTKYTVIYCIDKNFASKFLCMPDESDISNRAVPRFEKTFSEYFSPVCDSLVSADMGIQKCG